MSVPDLSSTPRTGLRRHRERGRTDRDDLYAVLDAGLICHLGVIADGAPRVLPTGYGRVDDTLYLHGSSANGTFMAAAGRPRCSPPRSAIPQSGSWHRTGCASRKWAIPRRVHSRPGPPTRAGGALFLARLRGAFDAPPSPVARPRSSVQAARRPFGLGSDGAPFRCAHRPHQQSHPTPYTPARFVWLWQPTHSFV